VRCFEDLSAVLMKIQVFWDVTPCRLVNRLRKLLALLDPEGGGNTLFRNVGRCLSVDTV
jgi:hypothetical protein